MGLICNKKKIIKNIFYLLTYVFRLHRLGLVESGQQKIYLIIPMCHFKCKISHRC